MNAARVKISSYLFMQAIPFPPGTVIREAKVDACGDLEFVLEHSSLPEVKDGQIPEAHPMFSRHEPVSFDGWGLEPAVSEASRFISKTYVRQHLDGKVDAFEVQKNLSTGETKCVPVGVSGNLPAPATLVSSVTLHPLNPPLEQVVQVFNEKMEKRCHREDLTCRDHLVHVGWNADWQKIYACQQHRTQVEQDVTHPIQDKETSGYNMPPDVAAAVWQMAAEQNPLLGQVVLNPKRLEFSAVLSPGMREMLGLPPDQEGGYCTACGGDGTHKIGCPKGK